QPWSRSRRPCGVTPWLNCSTTNWMSSGKRAGTRENGAATMKAHRLARVAEVIREVASETILFEVRDPRVKGVTVTRAEVSGDLQHAKVYVCVMGTAGGHQCC